MHSMHIAVPPLDSTSIYCQ